MKKIVLITGSSRGIGAELAKIFAKNNYNVIINYNNSKESANQLKKKLESSYNVIVETFKCDVSVEKEVKEMYDFVINKFNRIDVLINNASIAIDTDIRDKKVEDFRKVLDVNLIGTFLVGRLFGEYMKQQGFGSIINISSTNGIDTYYPESVDYDVSKAGIISLTHNFAKYYAPIRVNCVCPGWVNTDMNKELDEGFKKKEIEKILLKRFAEPEEIAETVYFTAISTYMNDSIIRVDGGYNG